MRVVNVMTAEVPMDATNKLDEAIQRVADKWPKLVTIATTTFDDALEWNEDYDVPNSVIVVGFAMAISAVLAGAKNRNAPGVQDTIEEVLIPLIRGEGEKY